MSFSTRISLQWLPEPESEETSTYVLTTPGNHFVDIRINKDHYPVSQRENSVAESEKVFNWVSTGVEDAVEGTEEIKFLLNIDSLEVWESQKTGKPLSECRRAPDLGFFYEIPGSLDRKETGNMVNPDTGASTDYIEIWRSLDPQEHTPTTEVREKSNPPTFEVQALVLDLDKHEGKYVRLGKWSQGLIHDKETGQFHVSRSWFNGEKWEHQIEFGSLDFPFDFTGKKGETATVNGLSWSCIE